MYVYMIFIIFQNDEINLHYIISYQIKFIDRRKLWIFSRTVKTFPSYVYIYISVFFKLMFQHFSILV